MTELARPASAPIALGGMNDEQLDENVQALIPSLRDADRTALALLLVERHKRCRTDEAWAWIKDCETLYFLDSHTFVASWICGKCGFEYWWGAGVPEWDIPPFTPIEDLPDDFTCPRCMEATLEDFQTGVQEPLWRKYAQSPTWTWAAFAMDTLDMSPGAASARKRTWEVYHVGLGWSVEALRLAGPSRLGLAVGEMGRSLRQGGDPELTTLLLGGPVLSEQPTQSGLELVEVHRKPATWYEVWDYVKAKRRAREVAEGKTPSVLFRIEELYNKKGDDLGFAVKVWYDDLSHIVGTFVWDGDLQPDLREIFKENLLTKLRK